MSLTGGERSALRWLLAVAVIGAGSQLLRNWRHSGAISPVEREALSRQLLAVDSAQRAGRRGTRAGRGRTRAAVRGAVADSTAGAGTPTHRRARLHGNDWRAQQPTLERVDLDQADSAALERLPRIGPALAARIVADRIAHGPFGSLVALQRVRGIGPGLARALDSLVTFSAIPRPSSAQR
jgi:competence protein ComEA